MLGKFSLDCIGNGAYMNGILNILKPPGMTSFDVVGFLRGVTRIKKIGHTGTLDPAAIGVLPICIGSSTKTIEYITNKDKIYRAEVTLGFSTDTQDSTGTVLEEKPVNVTQAEIEECLQKFSGNIKQIPPMYSAVKVNGKKLYELAREGIEIERKARDITIYSIRCVRPLFKDLDGKYKFMIEVHCSKGTYIRTLCHDIGQLLGTGANMSFLIRTKAGNFHIDKSVTLDEVADVYRAGEIEKLLLQPEGVFEDFSSITLEGKEVKKYLNGVIFDVANRIDSLGEEELIRVYDNNNEFLGLGKLTKRENEFYLKSEKLF